MMKLKQALYMSALTLAIGLSPSAMAENPAAHNKSMKSDNADVEIYINRVVRPYDLLKKVTAEVSVLDAKSEEDAELKAFKQLKRAAVDAGADALIEVKRYVIKDNIADRRVTPSSSGSTMKDDMDSTAFTLDELTLDSYNLNKGTLSTRPIEQTFERAAESQKVVRFTGKAIKFSKKE